MRAPTALPFGIPSVICASGGAVALGERDTREAISSGSSPKWWVAEGSTCVLFIAPGEGWERKWRLRTALITISENFGDGRKINGQNKEGNEPCVRGCFFTAFIPNYRLF